MRASIRLAVWAALLQGGTAFAAADDAAVLELAKRAAQGQGPARAELERLAESGEMLPEHYLGMLSLYGRGLPQSEQRAAEWFARAADKGHLPSVHNLAVIRGEGMDPTQRDLTASLRLYRSAAERGYAPSQANLGRMLAEGIGTATDIGEARSWLEKAAAQNDALGQYRLGMLYLDGRGVDKDPARGAALVQLAAEKRLPDAQYRLALLHGTGTGVEKDDRKAVEWLRKAAEQRHVEAQYLMAVAFTRGLYGFPRNQEMAAEWLRRAALQGLPAAEYELGVAFRTGRGVPKDLSQALGWFVKAAKSGHPEAIETVRQIRDGAAKQKPGEAVLPEIREVPLGPEPARQ
ncbi:MAG: tetratricopeptide repeat protein [Betaproteobacteria bacterium]